MKKLASLLVAASAALACAQSFALAPTAVIEYKLNLSGASAQDSGLLKVFQNLCVPGTVDYYTNTSANKPRDYNAYSCAINTATYAAAAAAAGVAPAGNFAARDANADGVVNTILYKRSAGGSGKGFSGVCADPVVAVSSQLVVDAATCTATAFNGFNGVPGVWYACTTTTNVKSDGGLSDLEKNKLPVADTGSCDTQPTLVNKPIWGTIFNTPVSLNFRDALQCVQGKTVGSETEADMPNLPKEVIASAFNGGLTSWDKLQALKADGVTYAPLSEALASRIAAGQCPTYNAALYPVPTTAAQKRVVVCRRPNSSGTNNQFRVKFLNAGCTSEAQDLLGDNTTNPANTNTATTVTAWQDIGTSSLTAAIVEASSGGNLGSCLSAFSSPNEAASIAGQKWAIGVQSLENNVSRAEKYRFIKIDGDAPTVANVLTHKYFNWVESVWFWLPPVTLDEQTAVHFQQILLTDTGAAAQVGELVTQTFTHSFGASGVVALNTIPGNVITNPVTINPALPVATASHSNGGASSCRTPQIKVNTAF